MSWICGVQAQLAKGVTGVASMPQYAVGYYSPFAERGDSLKEEGFYLGLKVKAFSNLNLAASYDIFRFAELDPKYYALPSSGHDARLYVSWKQNRWISWDGMYQHKKREETKKQLDADTFLLFFMPVRNTSNRVQLTFETRLDTHFDLEKGGAFKSLQSQLLDGLQTKKGWLVYQQLNWKRGAVTLKTRLARF
ncbi:MAG: hypothetical protein HGB15_05145 [Chlorobaculum sp.]|nr:hypothetical protein [Chlorobaculum sp.]